MKNGIIMIDFANHTRLHEDKSIHDAIHYACMVRCRPILMTTFAAMMGAVPIALGLGGMSADSRRPLGIVIVGGLIFSQILTLYLTPVIYVYIETLHEKIKNFRKNKQLKDGGETPETPHSDDAG
jgi:HAE1 family hydrophobic/amphiphilic exporter-1